MKTKEELFIPRFKVLSDYPGGHLKVGEVIDWNHGRTSYDAPNEFEKYPKIFKKLDWFEERETEAEEMPEYVKINVNHMSHVGANLNDIFKVIKFDLRKGCWRVYIDVKSDQLPLSYVLPATKEEYDLFMKDKMISTIQTNINTSGNLQSFMPAISTGMICEYDDCSEHNGLDYKRLPEETEPGWEDEPIFLCEKHARGHEIF